MPAGKEPPLPLAVGTLVAGRYRVDAVLGRGGMGAVFRATDIKFRSPVALKATLPEAAANPELCARFEREAFIGNALGRSQGFVRATDWGVLDQGGLYLVMDLIDGARGLDVTNGTLAQRVGQVVAAARLVGQAHALGVVHRDLKPPNFLVGRAGDVFLADFGLAKLVTAQGAEPAPGAPVDPVGLRTQERTAFGTPPYMPPEQFEDVRSVDGRADVYALGVMLFQALTGKLPYAWTGKWQALVSAQERVREGTAPAPRPSDHARDLPPALEALCLHALELDRARRLASAEELARRAEAALTASTSPSPAEDAATVPPRRDLDGDPRHPEGRTTPSESGPGRRPTAADAASQGSAPTTPPPAGPGPASQGSGPTTPLGPGSARPGSGWEGGGYVARYEVPGGAFQQAVVALDLLAADGLQAAWRAALDQVVRALASAGDDVHVGLRLSARGGRLRRLLAVTSGPADPAGPARFLQPLAALATERPGAVLRPLGQADHDALLADVAPLRGWALAATTEARPGCAVTARYDVLAHVRPLLADALRTAQSFDYQANVRAFAFDADAERALRKNVVRLEEALPARVARAQAELVQRALGADALIDEYVATDEPFGRHVGRVLASAAAGAAVPPPPLLLEPSRPRLMDLALHVSLNRPLEPLAQAACAASRREVLRLLQVEETMPELIELALNVAR